jgi:uncharacterized protein
MNSKRPEFITDTMLRGLGRWLRILGFLTAISENFEAAQNLLKNSTAPIFLTCSPNHFQQITESSSYLLKKYNIAEQLQEINDRFHIFQTLNLFSICSLCNLPVRSISKVELKERIPGAVKDNFKNFRICPGCQRIYWQGGHIQRLLKKLKRMGIPVR